MLCPLSRTLCDLSVLCRSHRRTSEPPESVMSLFVSPGRKQRSMITLESAWKSGIPGLNRRLGIASSAYLPQSSSPWNTNAARPLCTHFRARHRWPASARVVRHPQQTLPRPTDPKRKMVTQLRISKAALWKSFSCSFPVFHGSRKHLEQVFHYVFPSVPGNSFCIGRLICL